MLKSVIAAAFLATSAALAPMVQAAPANCWIIPEGTPSTQRVDGFRCHVVERTNANGHTVYDITHFQGRGAQFTVVLWTDGTAEVVMDGEVVEFPWHYDHDGDTRLVLGHGNGQFVF